MNSDQAINIIYNPYEENREKIKIVGDIPESRLFRGEPDLDGFVEVALLSLPDIIFQISMDQALRKILLQKENSTSKEKFVLAKVSVNIAHRECA